MNHEKLNEYSKIAALITSSMEGLLKAQDLLVDIMCRECDIPTQMKQHMIADMNKVIGVTLSQPS